MTQDEVTKEFAGFEHPEENWSKLPHVLIEMLDRFSSLAELKVVLYILRHTWGFQEFKELKRITLDEFQHGRKRKDRSRLDKGTGMSKDAIREGLSRAVKDGFIVQSFDPRPRPGRPAHQYQLKVLEVSPLADSKGEKLVLQVPEVSPSTEKDTLERYPDQKDTIVSANADSNLSTCRETDPDLPILTKKSPGYVPGPGQIVSCEDPDTGETVGEPSWRFPQGQIQNQAFAVAGRLRFSSRAEWNKMRRIERMLEDGELPPEFWDAQLACARNYRWPFKTLMSSTLNPDRLRGWEASQR